MQMQQHDFLVKALLDTQERVRDFMSYADNADDPSLVSFFRQYALTEGLQAQKLQEFLKE